jgi:hypothetical protein
VQDVARCSIDGTVECSPLRAGLIPRDVFEVEGRGWGVSDQGVK